MPAAFANSDAEILSMRCNSQIVSLSSSHEFHNLWLEDRPPIPHSVSMAHEDKNGGPNNLRAWRLYRKMSLEQLAEAVDTNANQIGYLETGERGLSLKWLRRLAPALKINVGWLAEHDPNDLPADIIEIWSTADERQRVQISAIAAALVKNGTDG